MSERRYVFTAGGGAFHRPDCELAASIPEAARSYSDSRQALVAQGLVPCPLCCPMGAQDFLAMRQAALEKLAMARTFDVDTETEEE